MRRLIALLAAFIFTLALAGTAIGGDADLPHTGRVLVSVGGDVTVTEGEQADLIVLVNADALVEGTVNTIVVVDGTATLRGATTETLFITNGSASVDAATDVLHGIRQLNSTVNAPAGVSVLDLSADVAAFGLFIGAAAAILWIGVGLATLLVGVLLAGVAARQLRSATDVITQAPGRTAIAGLLGIILPPLLTVLAVATLVGIPLGVGILIVIWPILAFAGYVVGALWIGLWLQGRRGATRDPAARPYGAMLIGLLITFVLGFVPLFTFVVSFFGMGAVLLATWRTLRGGTSPAFVAHPQPTPVAS